jgi:tRNA (guanosine-2'-O-)-methyltransferase
MNEEKLIEFLSGFVTRERLELFDKILNERTRYITVALEDIYQPHNASAVLRSMDCFGIQDVHIIENQNEYQVNPDVALGASKWLTMNRHNQGEENTVEAIHTLRKMGYRIVSTSPHKDGVSLENFDLARGKVALFFGTEMRGLSDSTMDNSDEFLKIPMFGFTESFNISVSAAVILHHLTLKLRESNIQWHLSDREKTQLKLQWLTKSIKRSDLLIEEFLSKNKNN